MTISNSETVLKATDEMISDLAKDVGRGEFSRVEFLDRVTAKYLAGELNFVARKLKSGKVADPVEADYAEHALRVWNATSARVKGYATIKPVKESRKSELSAIFQAANVRADIVGAARNAMSELTAEADADADAKDFNVRTYDGIVKVARAQKAKAKDATDKSQAPMTDAEVKAVFAPVAKERDEAKEMEAIIKRLEKMAEDFPHNKDVYNVAAEGLTKLLDMVNARKARAADEQAYAELAARLGKAA